MMPSPRRGVASIIGMLFLALVLMAAIGAQVYLSGVESGRAAGASQALDRQAQHSIEGLEFTGSGSGTRAVDTGPTSVTAVAMILRFENGTFYYLGSSSSPAFTPASVAAGGTVSLVGLVPPGACTPSAASCLSKLNAIVGGGPVAGRGVAVVTSMGNSFWYYPASEDPTNGGGGALYRNAATQSTSSTILVALPGLSFAGSPNTFYSVRLELGYYQTTAATPGVAFGISLPAGSTFLFCGGMFWSNPVSTAQAGLPGNTCTGTTNTVLGATTSAQTYCTSSVGACEFGGTAYVSFGSTAGNFQILFGSPSGGAAYVLADSVISVSQAS